MAKQHNSILILGEGPTEFYYFHSLRDELRSINIKPDYPKHTSMKELELKIEEGITLNYSHIFCVIDMDNKDEMSERQQYEKLKRKYAKPVNKPKKGIHCEVRFYETYRCTELFFIYYFKYTSRAYVDQRSLLKDLNSICPYEKTEAFFRKNKGLHGYFEKNGGKLSEAIAHGNQSLVERDNGSRDYTYSELGRMIEDIRSLMK